MPYENNEQLPDKVKKVLPPEAQNVFRGAFNAEFEKSKDEASSMTAAWGAVKKAGFVAPENGEGEWKKESKKESFEFDAEVFSVGVWNGDKYTIEDLRDMARNFDLLNTSVKPPVKLGHNTDQMKDIMKDGQPALGWVKSLKVVGEKLVATLTEVPIILKDLIKAGRYKRVSSEIYWGYKHDGKTFNRVLSAVAFLGADIPAVSNLADLVAYLSQSTDPLSGSFGEVKGYSFDVTGGAITNQSKKENMMDDTTKAMLKEYQDKISDLTAKLETATGNMSGTAEALEKMKKDYTDLQDKFEAQRKERIATEKTSKLEKLKAFCESMVKGGKMTPAARDILVGENVSLHYDEEKAIYSFTMEQFEKFMEKQVRLLEFDEKGQEKKADRKGEYTDAGKELDKRAREYQKENKAASYSEAVAAVLREDSELAAEYTKGGEE